MSYPIFTPKIPRRGHVFIAAVEEPDQADVAVKMEESTEGIEQKHNTVYMRERPQWRGWLVCIGAGVPSQLYWGDEVALKNDGCTCWHNPFRSLDGSYTNSGIYPNPSVGHDIFMDNEHKMLICRPEEMIIYRHRNIWDSATKEEPLYKRLLVKYDDRDAGLIDEATGLILGGYGVSEVFERDGFGKVTRDAAPNVLARVLDVGFDIDPDDYRVGDWVLCAPNAGTMITKTDGEYGMIESSDVPVNFGSEKPADRVEWKSYREEMYA